MNNIHDVFVINLKKCTNRLASLTKNMNDYGIKFKTWDAVNGKDLPYSVIKQRTSYLCRQFLCNAGTIGCHLSHLNLWQFIADNYGSDPDVWFIVLEDDSTIMDGFKQNIANIFNEMKQWPIGYRYPEFIHLSCNFMCKTKIVTPSIYLSTVFNTTRAYLISAKGASKLVRNIKKVHYHVDAYLTFRQIFYANLAYYTTNVFIGNNDHLVSTISHNTFPRSLPLLLNALIPTQSNHLHIIYESQILTLNNTIPINITILFSIFFLAILLANRLYIASSVYLIFEVVCFLISISHTKETTC